MKCDICIKNELEEKFTFINGIAYCEECWNDIPFEIKEILKEENKNG